MLSIKGNLIVLLKLALNCKLWTENNLPSLNGIKAIDNQVATKGRNASRDVINVRPSHNLQTSRRLLFWFKVAGPGNHMRLGQATSSKQQAT